MPVPPLVWITIAFALGIGVAATGEQVMPGVALAAAILVLSFTILSFWRVWRETPLYLLLCFLILGIIWGECSETPFPASLQPFLGHYVDLEGTLDALPAEYPNRVVYGISDPVVKLGGDSWHGSGRIQVVVYTGTRGLTGDGGKAGRTPAARVYPGRRLLVKGRLDRAPLPANPGDFNYRAYLERKGIIAVLTADTVPGILEQKRDARYLLPQLLASARLRIENGIVRSVPPEQAVLLRGFLLGSTDEITPEDRQIYQRTGVMHLFAVSGLNVGFVLLLFIAAARLLHLLRVPAFLFVTLGIWCYAALTGFPPSVTRAAVMGTVGLGASLWQQRQHLLNSLALAALLILLADPAALLDPGFQLSFAATWGITSLSRHLDFLFPFLEGNRLLLDCREVITVSLAAQLAVLPLCALYFQLVPVFGLLANILVVPLAGVVVNLGLAGMLLGLLLPPLATPFFVAAGALTIPIQGLLKQLVGVPGISLAVPQPSLWLLIAWYPLLVSFSRSIGACREIPFPHFRFRPFARRYLVPSLTGLVCLFLVMYAGGLAWPLVERPLRVTFLSVGQGDAVLIELPNGRSMLVDAGGQQEFSNSSFDPGQQIVLPYLIRSGIRRLDILVNSHPHEDHLGGIPAVLAGIPVGKIVMPPVPQPTPLMLRVEGLARERKIPVYTVHAGASLKIDPRVRVDVVSPPEIPYSSTDSDPNNNSLVLLMRYGDISFLLTGDAEDVVLDRLAACGLPRDTGINVLKAPHHGSRNGISQALAARFRPRFVVISVGRNTFGHPDTKTVDFWREHGASILRTDENGAVIFETDGKKLWLKVFRQSPKLMPMARAA